MEGRTAKRYCRIDRESPLKELRKDLMIHPHAEFAPLNTIAPLHPKNTEFELQKSDNGEVQGCSIYAGQPGEDMSIGFSVAGFTQLGNHIGVEQEH